MRKHFSRLCLALLLTGLLPAFAFAVSSVQISDAESGLTLLQQDDHQLRARLDIGFVDISEVATKEGTFSLVAVHGLSRSNRVGEPSLPMAGRMISIPFGCELKAEVIRSEVQEINLNNLGFTAPILPVQPSVSKSDDPESIPFEFNEDLYQVAGFYQLPMIETEIVGEMRGVRMGRISINPFEYNPTEGVLKVYTKVEVEVSFENADWFTTELEYNQYYSPLFEPVYARAMNYQAMYANRGDKANLLTYPIGFVILSDRMFEAQLQPFIEWKTRKGFDVHVAYFDVISNNRTAVKNYMDSLYTNMTPAPSMALIVGDAQQLDPWAGTAGSHVTDLYFFEFTGDIFPEMWYGRFSAQNPAQLQPQIDKTLEYEQYLMPDPSYLAEVTLVAGVDGSWAITHGNGQINYGTNYYFNAAHGIDPHVWLYPASAGSVAGDIIQTVSDGVALYNYTAHCSHSGHADPSFTTSDIPGLTNYNKYLLGIGNCCLPNTFDESTPCFGEAFLQVADKGGIGYVGATNSTYWDEDYWWGVGYGAVVGDGPTYEQTGPGAFDGMFHDHGEPESAWYVVNGAISPAGNYAVTEAGASREEYYWEAYHLMGDPSVMTYLGVPAVNNVYHDATLLMTATSITVQADPASYVGVTFGGQLMGAGYVDASGSVTFPLEAFGAPGEAEIVITGQFKQPYIGTIQVITPSGPYVIHDYANYSEVTGNGNGVVDAGEELSISLGLVNVGPDDALNVEAYITTTDTYVTILDDTETYGTILADNGTGYVADGFSFSISSDAPDGHRVTFDLEVAGENRESWFGQFNVTVHAPDLEVLNVVIDDDAGGDGNGILDPGETALLTVTLRNNGTGEAFSVDASVSETDQYVSFGNAYAYYGDMDSLGGTANNVGSEFVLTADENCPLGYAVPIAVAASGANGYGANLAFNITVGDRVVFFYDDFAYDQGWTGLGGSAEWEIGPTQAVEDDPGEDHTPTSDNHVLANDLNGDYNNNISGTQWVYSPLIDCGTMSGVEMTYYHWLGIESNSYDHAYFEVYDGSTWQTLYESGGTSQETEWTYEFYDLSAYADSNPNFQLRWGLGSTDGSATYSGWTIDDIEIKGYGRVGLPDLSIDADPIIDSLQPGNDVAETIVVRNLGEGTLRIWFETTEDWIDFDGSVQAILPGDSLMFDVMLECATMDCGTHVGGIHFTTNDAGNPEGDIPVTAHIYSPDIALSHSDVTLGLEIGYEASRPVTITNTGPGRLDWVVASTMLPSGGKSTPGPQVASETPIMHRPGDADKSDRMESVYAPRTKGFGGPDTFGHHWVDSDESGGPALDWVDISTLGTEVTLGDDEASGAISLGMGFPFYDSVYTQLFIGSNGIVCFDEASAARYNLEFPHTNFKAGIGMFWDDLDPRRGNSQIVHYYDAANERFIVSFNEVTLYLGTTGTGSLNFQVHLYADGTVQLHYGVMDPGEKDLLSAGIGIQNSTQDDGLTILNNAAYMHDNLAIEIASQRWLSVSPAGGSIQPYNDSTIQVLFDATELEAGVYNGLLQVTSNDPDTPSMTIPVALTVTEPITYICGDADGNGEAAIISDLVYLVAYMFSDGPPPPEMAAVDVDGSPGYSIGDLVYMVDFMFNGGPALNCE